MSTSVIQSARKSTAGIFDFIGTTAHTANQLVNTASKGIDMLDAKVAVTHQGILDESLATQVFQRELIIKRKTREYVEELQEIQRMLNPNAQLNLAEVYAEAEAKITAAFASA